MSNEPVEGPDQTTDADITLDGVPSDVDEDQPPIEVKRTPRLRSGKHEDTDSTG